MQMQRQCGLTQIAENIQNIKIIKPSPEISDKVDYKYILEYKSMNGSECEFVVQVKIDKVESFNLESLHWDQSEALRPILTDIKDIRVICDNDAVYKEITGVIDYITLKTEALPVSVIDYKYKCLLGLIRSIFAITCYEGLPATTELVMLQTYKQQEFHTVDLLDYIDMIINLLYKLELVEMNVLTYNPDYDNSEKIAEMFKAFDDIDEVVNSIVSALDFPNGLAEIAEKTITDLYCTQDIYQHLTPQQFKDRIERDLKENADERDVEPMTFLSNVFRSILVDYDNS